MVYITLSEWNRRQPRPRCMETLRRAARNVRFDPPEIFEGREYLVDETAERVSRNNSLHSSNPIKSLLVSRIKHGTPEKP
ncbi:excisionase [Candidatus Symbiopectobacterium sp.]|uniref:excisionase n=1 Tax=Candidatus Symbiopectobacterium sp. TaxID=2816440 RepID=UPI00345C6679